MSSQHTAGEIRYEYEPGYCGELIAQDGMTIAAFVDEPSEANARRLVACWNACEGISTEHLEDDAVRKLMQDRDLLLAQRDELLAELKKALDSLEYVEKHLPGLAGCGVRQERIASSRAAIADTEGGAA